MVSLLIFVISIIIGRMISNYYYSLKHTLDLNYYHYLFGFPVIGIVLAVVYYKRFSRMKRGAKPRISQQQSNRQNQVFDEHHR